MADSSSRQRISKQVGRGCALLRGACGVGVYIWTGLFLIAFELRVDDTMLNLCKLGILPNMKL